MGENILFLNTHRNGYKPGQCGKTLSVGELIEILSNFNEDTLIYLKNDNGYTYGNISECDINLAEETEI